MRKRIRVIVVDDHLMVRKGLRLLLEEGKDIEWIGEATDGESAIHLVEQLHPDVVLMDIRMPNRDGISALKHIRKMYPNTQVLLLTTYDDDDLIVQGFRAGACGYLLKDIPLEKLLQAIQAASEGEVLSQPETIARLFAHTNLASQLSEESASNRHVIADGPHAIQLTKREQEVLNGVAQGETSKEIAFRLGIAERTVRAYLTSIYNKLNVDSRAAAVSMAFRHGLLEQRK